MTLCDEAVFVRGDEHRLHQVIANLVANAITHTAEGTPVRVTVSRRAAAGPPAEGRVHAGSGPAFHAEAAVVEVHDDGAGIDPGDLPYVFDRFYRADASRSRSRTGDGGNGLGLAIAAALVQAHCGRIEVTSGVGDGTTFRVLLPRHHPADG
ncbi:cell wall metabolism sensor histidine kinase WalK [Microbispora sp. GKU 823]|uniref:sensor histidine kinase n=1 Tax=Microbispora sp. GKU 823 TaxID=1652100 RepID=UPI001C4E206D|nr:ATP-binding protein [Microbispora sp. GKU 823]